ncbi:MAG: CopG family transcriptional regulator [Elusimicrobia bacterium]|nr:CopG family transcriptional regulator [Elusimicrobiota bacterium]
MIKRMIYLEDSMAAALQRIARSENKSVSELVRQAIGKLFEGKEYYDLARYDERMAEYLGKPSSAAPFREIMDD